jgi:hypothetical protein
VYGLDATLQAQPFSIRCCELYPHDESVENRLLEFLSKARVGRVTVLTQSMCRYGAEGGNGGRVDGPGEVVWVLWRDSKSMSKYAHCCWGARGKEMGLETYMTKM